MIEQMPPGDPPRRAPIDPVLSLAMIAVACTAPNPAYRPTSLMLDAAIGGDAGRSGDQTAGDALAANVDTWEPEAGGGPSDGSPDLSSAADGAGALPLPTVQVGTTLVQHGGTGGTATTDLCPQNEVLIGYRGTLGMNGRDLVVNGVEGQCGRLAVAGIGPYALTTNAGDRLPRRGSDATMTFTALCAANQVVVGLQGRAGTVLDQLQLQCAPLSTTTLDSLSIGATTLLPPAGGTGGSAFQATCPAGQVARGQDTNSGNVIDAFALVCGTIVP
jgi:hypothetical protein